MTVWSVRASAVLGVLALACLPPTRGQAQSAAPPFTESAERPEDFPGGAGREETFYACVACHNFKLIAAQGMSRDKWDETLTWMTTRHNMPEINGKDRELILNYLEKHYPSRPARGGWRNPFSPQ
jgi:mono/diheme cytochrome c family protein